MKNHKQVKRMWMQRNFVSKKLCVQKVWDLKILGKKNCVKIKFWIQNNFGKKYLIQEEF